MPRGFSKEDFDGDRAAAPRPDPLRNGAGTWLVPHFDGKDELTGGKPEARREAGGDAGARGARFSDGQRSPRKRGAAKTGAPKTGD